MCLCYSACKVALLQGSGVRACLWAHCSVSSAVFGSPSGIRQSVRQARWHCLGKLGNVQAAPTSSGLRHAFWRYRQKKKTNGRYTESNARFALTMEPNNAALRARVAEVGALRAQGLPTVPSTLALEKATNPFLRPDSAELRAPLGMAGEPTVDVFAETRRRKDRF